MKGYTLIEMLLTIALLAIIFMGSYAIIDNNFIYRTELEEATGTSIRAIKTAQANSMIKLNSSNWGIRFQNGKCIVYKGNNFDSRDSSFDITYFLTNNISFSGDTDLNFEINSGELSSNKTINIFNRGNKTKTLNINIYGQIDE